MANKRCCLSPFSGRCSGQIFQRQTSTLAVVPHRLLPVGAHPWSLACQGHQIGSTLSRLDVLGDNQEHSAVVNVG